MKDNLILRALRRGDVRQAIGYELQIERRMVPEDVNFADFVDAARRGVGTIRWWKLYADRRGDSATASSQERRAQITRPRP